MGQDGGKKLNRALDVLNTDRGLPLGACMHALRRRPSSKYSHSAYINNLELIPWGLCKVSSSMSLQRRRRRKTCERLSLCPPRWSPTMLLIGLMVARKEGHYP